MSSEGDALGASYSLGERDYDVDASSLADPYVQEEGTGRPGISLLSVSAWAIALVSLWVYRRAVIRALQAARGGTRVSPRAALVHVRSALKACSAASRRRFAATWSAFRGKPSRDASLFPEEASEPPSSSSAPRRVEVTVDPPGVEDGRWTQHWDVSPRPSMRKDEGPQTTKAEDDGKTTTTTEVTKERDDTSDETSDDDATFPGVATKAHSSRVARGSADVRFLCDALPRAHRHDGWRLLYCAARDGFSLRTLFRKCAGSGACVTLVEDERGGAFGAFTSEPWRLDPKPYGDGRCFVFTLRKTSSSVIDGTSRLERDRGRERDVEQGKNNDDDERVAYRWDPKRESSNYSFQAGRVDALSLGGGNGFALWLDGDLLNGASAACDTFGTTGPLSFEEAFKVRAVQVWGFEPLRRVSVDGAASPRGV